MELGGVTDLANEPKSAISVPTKRSTVKSIATKLQ